jgi:hypothetical protein
MGFRPEEKGIKTEPALEFLFGQPGMGFRPEEKGIKTPDRFAYPLRPRLAGGEQTVNLLHEIAGEQDVKTNQVRHQPITARKSTAVSTGWRPRGQ